MELAVYNFVDEYAVLIVYWKVIERHFNTTFSTRSWSSVVVRLHQAGIDHHEGESVLDARTGR